jgi:hypothetical protein
MRVVVAGERSATQTKEEEGQPTGFIFLIEISSKVGSIERGGATTPAPAPAPAPLSHSPLSTPAVRVASNAARAALALVRLGGLFFGLLTGRGAEDGDADSAKEAQGGCKGEGDEDAVVAAAFSDFILARHLCALCLPPHFAQ